jgi:AdoMet-dependent rRNA methyltransferase SPB1
MNVAVLFLILFDSHISNFCAFKIGAAYNKDAYVQNELVLAALKTATEHLVPGGSFCTKVYRSTDYNALIWVFQQLFEEVQAMKPNSSRSQSSEIFIVCLKYTAPNSIDPKLLDPNHVFKEINDPGLQKVDVMHKKYEKLNKRHRTGYDESLGMLLTSKVSVLDFIQSKDTVSAIRVLTDANIIEFPEECDEIAQHPATTDEIRLCFSDLRVLGKLDFKKILKWREIMRTFFFSSKPAADAEKGTGEAAENPLKRRHDTGDMDVDAEIERMNSQVNQADKRDKKKTRLKASKERQRQVLGISANAFGDADDMELFTLGHATRASQLGGVNEVDLDDEDDDNQEIWMDDYAKLDEKIALPSIIVADENDLENELESQYKRFVAGKRILTEQSISEEQLLLKDAKDERTLEGRSKSAKSARLSRTSEAILARKEEEDFESGGSQSAKNQAENNMKSDLSAYVQLLSGAKVKSKPKGKKGEEVEAAGDDTDTSDEDVEEGEGGFDDEDDEEGPLASKSVRLTGGARAEKWFTHPIFSESLIDKVDTEKDAKKDHRRANQVIAEMPKTDKEIRKEKRKKSKERQDRREQRKTDENKPENVSHFDIAPRATVDFGDDEDGVDNEGVVLDSETIRQRALIRQGMGTVMRAPDKSAPGKKRKADAMEGYETVEGSTDADDAAPLNKQAKEEPIEIVPREKSSHGGDDRSYDSDNEQYDSHDRAMTLALGTLMLRRSREKALVDASYNRFTWNDKKDLPTWFLDDEMKHNKPQLPVPEALLEQVGA